MNRWESDSHCNIDASGSVMNYYDCMIIRAFNHAKVCYLCAAFD